MKTIITSIIISLSVWIILFVVFTTIQKESSYVDTTTPPELDLQRESALLPITYVQMKLTLEAYNKAIAEAKLNSRTVQDEASLLVLREDPTPAPIESDQEKVRNAWIIIANLGANGISGDELKDYGIINYRINKELGSTTLKVNNMIVNINPFDSTTTNE